MILLFFLHNDWSKIWSEFQYHLASDGFLQLVWDLDQNWSWFHFCVAWILMFISFSARKNNKIKKNK